MLNILKVTGVLLICGILVACGSTWQLRTTSGQEFIVSDLAVNTQDVHHDDLPVREDNSTHRLKMDGVKRIVLDQNQLKKWDGRTWVKLRVDFEDEEQKGWNTPDSGLVGNQELYVLSSAFIEGESAGQKVKWPLSDLSEVVMEEETFLTKDAGNATSEGNSSVDAAAAENTGEAENTENADQAANPTDPAANAEAPVK